MARIHNQQGVFVHSLPPLPASWLGIDRYYFKHTGKSYVDETISEEYIYPRFSPLEAELERYRLWYQEYRDPKRPHQKILESAALAPFLLEVPGRIMRRLAQDLATAWPLSVLVNDDEPGFEVQLAEAVLSGKHVILVIESPETVAGFIHTIRYAETERHEAAYIRNRYVRVHSEFRICCVLKKGTSSWADQWRSRILDAAWLYKVIEA